MSTRHSRRPDRSIAEFVITSIQFNIDTLQAAADVEPHTDDYFQAQSGHIIVVVAAAE